MSGPVGPNVRAFRRVRMSGLERPDVRAFAEGWMSGLEGPDVRAGGVGLVALGFGGVQIFGAMPRLITVMWVQPLRVQSWPASGSRSSSWPASGSWSAWGRLPGVGYLVSFLGEVSEAGSPSGSRPWG